MKNTLIKVLALVIALCCVLPLIVACGDKPTETTTKKEENTKKEESTKEPESESVTDAPEEFETNDRQDDSICYVGPDALDPDSHFFSTLEDAVAAYPDGATIKFCVDTTLEEPFHFPETGEFFLEISGYDVDIAIDAGMALEYWTGGGVYYVYTNDLNAALKLYERNVASHNSPQLWVFAETDSLAVGRYDIVNVNEEEEDAEPEYRFDYFEDLSNWGHKYVANASWGEKTHYFYTLQEAMDTAQSDNSYVRINIMRDCEATLEDGILDLPYTSYYYRIPYNYHYVDGSFTRGVTYDDMDGGYCFYSSLDFLSAQPSLVDTYCWIWGGDDGFVTGKYHMTANVGNLGSDADLWDPETGLYYVMHVGQYVYTLVEDVSIDEFFEQMREYVDRGY